MCGDLCTWLYRRSGGSIFGLEKECRVGDEKLGEFASWRETWRWGGAGGMRGESWVPRTTDGCAGE